MPRTWKKESNIRDTENKALCIKKHITKHDFDMLHQEQIEASHYRCKERWWTTEQEHIQTHKTTGMNQLQMKQPMFLGSIGYSYWYEMDTTNTFRNTKSKTQMSNKLSSQKQLGQIKRANNLNDQEQHYKLTQTKES